MSDLCRFFKPMHGLPDARGDLASSVPSRAIATTNKEVMNDLMSEATGTKRRGPYTRLD